MSGHTTSTQPISFHTTSMTIILMALGMHILYMLHIFLFHLSIIPLMVVSCGFPFLGV